MIYLLCSMELELLRNVFTKLHGHQHSVFRTGPRSWPCQQFIHSLPTLKVPLLKLYQHADVDLDLPIEVVDRLQPVFDLVVDRSSLFEFFHLLVELSLHVLSEQDLDNLICVGDSLEDGLDVLAGVCRILHTVLVVLNAGLQVVQLGIRKSYFPWQLLILVSFKCSCCIHIGWICTKRPTYTYVNMQLMKTNCNI